jgi:dTDP-4-dehydrorhamnose 3,5-epimerase
MDVQKTPIAGVLVIEPQVFSDRRGSIFEAYHEARYTEAGIAGPSVQDNISQSRRGVLRGLHFESRGRQAKLVLIVTGEIFDVVVDLRRGSPTFGRWFGTRLSSENRRQIYIPPGCAHGFCVLSDFADVIFKSTTLFAPEYERGVIWNDPMIGIEWPLEDPVLPDRDAGLPRLHEAIAQ